MKRLIVPAVLLFLTGCSNAPIAGFLDCCFPSKASRSVPPSGVIPADRGDLPPRGDVLPPPAVDVGPPPRTPGF